MHYVLFLKFWTFLPVSIEHWPLSFREYNIGHLASWPLSLLAFVKAFWSLSLLTISPSKILRGVLSNCHSRKPSKFPRGKPKMFWGFKLHRSEVWFRFRWSEQIRPISGSMLWNYFLSLNGTLNPTLFSSLWNQMLGLLDCNISCLFMYRIKWHTSDPGLLWEYQFKALTDTCARGAQHQGMKPIS